MSDALPTSCQQNSRPIPAASGAICPGSHSPLLVTCFVMIGWKERPPFLVYTEIYLTQKALPLHTQGLPFWFGHHLRGGGCHFMHECHHFMGVSCQLLKHHTAL